MGGHSPLLQRSQNFLLLIDALELVAPPSGAPSPPLQASNETTAVKSSTIKANFDARRIGFPLLAIDTRVLSTNGRTVLCSQFRRCELFFEAVAGAMRMSVLRPSKWSRHGCHSPNELSTGHRLDPPATTAPRAFLVLETVMHGNAPLALAGWTVCVCRMQHVHSGDGFQMEL